MSRKGRQKAIFANNLADVDAYCIYRPNHYKDNGNIENSAFNVVNNCNKLLLACHYDNYKKEREIPELAYRRQQGDA